MVKIFAHRGYNAGNITDNSLASLDEAVKRGFHGIEIDIHFIDNQLIVTHDFPYSKDIRDLNLLEEFLIYEDILYWLDFKNLQYLDEKELNIALNMVLEAIKNSKCNLDQFYFAPYITDFSKAKVIYAAIVKILSPNTKIMAVCDDIESGSYQSLYENLLSRDIRYLSIKHSLISRQLVELLQGVEIFAWTVNDMLDAKNLTKNFSIQNFATDLIIPKQFFT